MIPRNKDLKIRPADEPHTSFKERKNKIEIKSELIFWDQLLEREGEKIKTHCAHESRIYKILKPIHADFCAFLTRRNKNLWSTISLFQRQTEIIGKDRLNGSISTHLYTHFSSLKNIHSFIVIISGSDESLLYVSLNFIGHHPQWWTKYNISCYTVV